MRSRGRFSELESRLLRVTPVEFIVGTAYETVNHLTSGIYPALIRGLEGGIEAVGLGILPVVAGRGLRIINGAVSAPGNAHRRFTNATFRLIPHFMYSGAVLNGIRQYFDGNTDTGVYARRLVEGGVVGGLAAVAPWLLYMGQRHGVYGHIRNAYVNANRGIYNFVNDRIGPAYGATKGRIAGIGAAIGTNAMGAGALYGITRAIL